MRYSILVLLVVCMFQSCIEISNQFSSIPPGIWRATLEIDDTPFAGIVDEVSRGSMEGDVLPFLMEVKYDSEQSFYIEIINGEERIPVREIRYGRDKATAKDTIWMDFPVYDSYIKAIYEENIMEGTWHVNYRDNYSIPFKAYYGQDHLFTTDEEEPVTDLTGRWETTFEVGTEDEYPAIGEFEMDGINISGTFLTETGDYRYLNGQMIGDKFFLSTFDGAHAFFFKGKVMEDGSLAGLFRSGKHYTTSWIASRNSEATLTSPYQLTKMLDETEPISFSFQNTEGKEVTLNDPEYQGKIKLVQIMGTWCPNCKDETKFLKNFVAEQNDDVIEVIAIGFEKYKDTDKAISSLKRFKEKWEIPYEVLYGGPSEKEEASRSFPMLNKIISYPTILFIDGNNIVRKIHTGFSGPATSGYEVFRKDFYDTINELRNNT